MWIANFENLSQVDQLPEEVRTVLAAAQQHGRLGLAELFHDLDTAADEERALAVGSFYTALLLGVMAQWVSDQERGPSGGDLAMAVRTIVADVEPSDEIDSGGR